MIYEALFYTFSHLFVFCPHCTDAIGQRVMTQFGEGTIHSFTESDGGRLQYSVKFQDDFRTLEPPAVLHNVDAGDDSEYIRQNKEMIKIIKHNVRNAVV